MPTTRVIWLAQERSILPGRDPRIGIGFQPRLGGGAVGGEIILPAEQVVIDPGRVRPIQLQVNLRFPRVGGVPVYPVIPRHSGFPCLRP